MGEQETGEPTTAHTGDADDPPTGRKGRKRRTGLLAHLPPVPKPVDVAVDGLSPKKAFYGWLLVVTLILVAGIGLNWAMTDGTWVPNEPEAANPLGTLGETPPQFITTDPYDLLTAFLFTISIVVLTLSLFTRHQPGKRMGLFVPLAAAAGGLGLLTAALYAIGPHLVGTLPRLAAFSDNSSLLIVAAVLGGLALTLLLIGAMVASKRHELRLAGWLVFAAHWALTGMYYYVNGGGDWVNMAFAYAAVFLLSYFAYQELVSRSLGEDNPSLRFTAAAVVLAAGVWYAFLRIEFLSEILIETVTVHTVWMLELLNQNVTIGEDGRTGFMSAISYPEAVFSRTVIIILACTAIQSMMIFVAAAVAVKDPIPGRMKVFTGPNAQGGMKTALFVLPTLVVLALSYWMLSGISLSPSAHLGAAAFVALPIVALWMVWVSGKPLSLMQRRLLVIAVTVPIVYVLNLTRNTGIIIMWADRWLEINTPGLVAFYSGLTGAASSSAAFSIAHNYIGKGGSLLALVAIAFIVFKILPEVLRALVGLLDLPRRRGPLEQYWRTLRGQRDPVTAETAETA